MGPRKGSPPPQPPPVRERDGDGAESEPERGPRRDGNLVGRTREERQRRAAERRKRLREERDERRRQERRRRDRQHEETQRGRDETRARERRLPGRLIGRGALERIREWARRRKEANRLEKRGPIIVNPDMPEPPVGRGDWIPVGPRRSGDSRRRGEDQRPRPAVGFVNDLHVPALTFRASPLTSDGVPDLRYSTGPLSPELQQQALGLPVVMRLEPVAWERGITEAPLAGSLWSVQESGGCRRYQSARSVSGVLAMLPGDVGAEHYALDYAPPGVEVGQVGICAIPGVSGYLSGYPRPDLGVVRKGWRQRQDKADDTWRWSSLDATTGAATDKLTLGTEKLTSQVAHDWAAGVKATTRDNLGLGDMALEDAADFRPHLVMTMAEATEYAGRHGEIASVTNYPGLALWIHA